MTTIQLKDFSERVFGSTSGSYHNACELVVEICSDEFCCQPDDVTSIEDDDGEEIICIGGEPKARLVHRNS
jgi:hypothetical protein